MTRLADSGITVKQQLRVRFEEQDVERLIALSDWTELAADATAAAPPSSPAAKGKGKAAPAAAPKQAATKGAKASPRAVVKPEECATQQLQPGEARRELAEALTRCVAQPCDQCILRRSRSLTDADATVEASRWS